MATLIIRILSAILALPLLGALGTYIAARILLPDMGLTVPGYMKFYWASVFIVLFATVVSVVSSALREDS